MYDARSGFHDIKPLPDYRSFDQRPVLLGLGIFALLVLLGIVFRILRRKLKGRSKKRGPLESPEQRALGCIKSLRARANADGLALAELASALSLCLREFVEMRSGYPAAERTMAELSTEISKIPALDQALSWKEELLRIVDSCEKLTFAPSTRSAAGSELEGLCAAAEQLIFSYPAEIRNNNQRAAV
jgi:hypothetical protein